MSVIITCVILCLLVTESFCGYQHWRPRPTETCAGCPVNASTNDYRVRQAASFVIQWLNGLRPGNFLLNIRRAQTQVSILMFYFVVVIYKKKGERGGSVVECRTPEREVRGSKPTAAVLCPWARHFTPRKYWLITQEAMAPSRHDWKIVDWDVKPQHNQLIYKKKKNSGYMYWLNITLNKWIHDWLTGLMNRWIANWRTAVPRPIDRSISWLEHYSIHSMNLWSCSNLNDIHKYFSRFTILCFITPKKKETRFFFSILTDRRNATDFLR